MKIKNLLHLKIQGNTLRLHSASTIHTESFGMTNSGTHENGTTQKKQDKIFILPLITLLTIVLFFNPQSYGHNFNNRSSAPSGPVITVGTLAPFENQCIHTASEIHSYIVSGTSLTGPIEITPPEGFEISPNGGVNFQPSSLIRLNPDASGSTPDVSIFVRFTPTGAQTYSDNITHTSSGADPQNVAVAGTGIAAPVADFTGTPIAVTAGGYVTFTDNSTNAPTSWAWSFPGGSPSSGTSQNPTVTYSTAGNYSVSLTAINDCGSDEETKTGYISVTNPCITPIATEPSTGDGSPGNPYQIATLENLYWIMADRTKWDKHYTQTANIDASSTVNWCTGGWLPIGDWYVNSSQGNVFSGSYDGKGHTISGLHVSNSKSVAFGLFGRAIGAVIKNIGITDVETTGVSGDAGALVGSASNCLIDNCYSTGTVAVNPAGSMYDAGGLVGILESSSNLSNSHSTCNVTGASSVGGLAGLILNYSTIKNCYYSGGTVDGSGSSMSATGGLVGVNDYYSSIQKCYSTGNVSGYDYSGGLVGSNSRNSLISNCFSRCTVSGNSSFGYNCGGLAGYNTENSQITKCYSTGAVGNLMGGLVGYNESGDVSDSYWDTQTSGTTWSDGGTGKTTDAMKLQSTFTGWDFSTIWGMNSGINDGYPYLQPESTCDDGTITLTSGTENQTICAGTAITPIVYTIGGGATDAKATGLPDGVTGSLSGNTFTISGTPTASGTCEYSVTTTGTPSPCSEGTAYGTITVKITPAVTAPSGDGTSGNPYRIANLANLYWIAENSSSWNKYFIQTANIDASSTADWCTGGWLPIGLDWENYFSGNYDGRGHTISGLYIASSPAEANGLFGYAEGAAFQNLGITDVRINGEGSTGASGALLGAAVRSVSIKNCFSTGEVKGRDNCGGLVGAIVGNSVVDNSYSTCNVIGNYSVGGLVGMTNMGNSIINCFHTTGTVVGVNSVGGLVGLNSDSSISKCYSTDKVKGDTHVGGLAGLNYDGTISDCYSRCTVINTSTFYSCGGLVGLHDGSNANILNCYSTGSVITGMGGLIGGQEDGATTSHSFWDTQTSGTTWSADGEGKSTSEMKTLSTFTDAGWDFTTIWGKNAIFNDGYPSLIPVTLTLLSGSNLQTVCAGEEIIPIVYVADGFESGVYVTPESSSGFAVLIEPEAKKFTITGSFTDAGSYTYTVIAAPTLFPWVGATVTGTITVNESFTPSVTISSNDANNIICANSEVIFTATPHNTGTGSVAYQWYYYNKLQNKLYDYNTWNGNTWTSNELEDGDEVYCEITVTGGCFTTPISTSHKITMEVYDSETRPSVTIESNPPGEICSGTTVTFTAIPQNTEGGKVDYKWFHNGTYQKDYWNQDTWWNSEFDEGDSVRCEITVTNAACYESATVSSNKFIISVTPWPDAGMVTGENVIQVGQSTTLAPDIPGGKWYCFEPDIATVDETGNVTGEDAGTTTIYYVIAKESQCYDEAVTLFPITVTSLQCTDGTISLAPGSGSANQNVCAGTAITPVVYTIGGGATGAKAIGLPDGVTVNYSGGTFTISGTPTSAEVYPYTVTTTGTTSPCTEVTATGTLTVNATMTPSISITSSDADNKICAGNKVTFTTHVSNTGEGTVAYVWIYNDIRYEHWGSTWTTTELEDGEVVSCEITITGGSCLTSQTALSNPITTNVYDRYTDPSVTITSDPAGEICYGTGVKLTATPLNTSGGKVSYQWKYNGDPIGSDDSDYWSDELENGDKVSCDITISNGACFTTVTAVSNEIVVAVIKSSVTIISDIAGEADISICEGATVNFTATPGDIDGEIVKYMWGRIPVDGDPILVSEESTYSTNSLADGDLIIFAIDVTGSPCGIKQVISNGIKVAVASPPVAGTLDNWPGQSIVCEGTEVNALLIPGSGGNGTDELEYSTKTGIAWDEWAPYGNEDPIATTGKTAVEVRTHRLADDCDPSGYTTVSWSVEPTPIAAILVKTPDALMVCEGTAVWAYLSEGPNGEWSGGNGKDQTQYRTQTVAGWSDWSNYSSGTSISTDGKTGVEIQTRRLADACTHSAYNTVSWKVEAKPATPIIYKYPDYPTVCEGGVSARTNIGYGFSIIKDILFYRTQTGSLWSDWLPYTRDDVIFTTGKSGVEIRAKRLGMYCGSDWVYVSWAVVPQPVAGVTTRIPDVSAVCEGTDVSATFTEGSGGVSCTDTYEYRYDGIGEWSEYTPAETLTTAGHSLVEIRTQRGGCQDRCNTDTRTVSWAVNLLPVIETSSASTSAHYSDPVNITITVTDVGLTYPLNVSTQFNTNGGAFVPGLPNGLSWINPSDGIWNITGVADVAPGVYIIRVDADDGQCSGYIDLKLTVRQENAIAAYTGQEFVGEQNPSASTTPLLLSASVIDMDDGFRGDIRNARVQFYDVNTLAPLSGWLTPGLVTPGDPTQGAVNQMWNAPVPATGYNTFTVGIRVGTQNPDENGYYLGSDKVVVNVFRTDLFEFISGGGHISPTQSKGEYASDPGRKVNFGFNVKWNKTLKNLQGNMSLVFRIGDKVYQIRTNALSSLSINSVNPCSQQAVFTSKANLTDITLPELPVAIKGNLNLQVTMTNNTSPGAVSTIGITVYEGNSLLYSSNWPVNMTEELPVDGGNLVVHNGIKCVTNNQVDVMLYSSKNPSFVGEEVIFKAVVTPKGSAIVPTGVVKFMDGSGDLATISLENGKASLAISDLSEGIHWVAAEYLSSGDFENNLSNIIEQKVAGAVLSIVSDKNPSGEGEPITFTATVTVPPGGYPPTGTVTFKDGENVLGEIDLSEGIASWQANDLTAGNHTITSEYSGDANYLPISASMVQTVGSNIQITLGSSKNPEQVNTSVSFTATVTSAGSPVIGTNVSFYINGVFWQITSTDVSGKAVLSNSFKVVGTYLIEARYAGQSASLSQVIKNKVKSAVIASFENKLVDNPEMKVYPNPFSDRLNFEFISPADDRVRIDIFDNSGRCIETVFDNLVKAGVTYNAVLIPDKLISGIYIYRMIMGDHIFNGKVIFNSR
jgi:hypothetical protein